MTVTQARRICVFSVPRSGSWGGTLMPEEVRLFADYLAGKHATVLHVRDCLLELLGELDHDAHVYVSPSGFIGLVIETNGGVERGGWADTWRVLDFVPVEVAINCCRRCGCTDALGCPDGCAWVEPDLCSACVP